MSIYRKRLTINDLCCKKRFNNTFYKQHRLPNKEFGHAHLAQVKVTNVTRIAEMKLSTIIHAITLRFILLVVIRTKITVQSLAHKNRQNIVIAW